MRPDAPLRPPLAARFAAAARTLGCSRTDAVALAVLAAGAVTAVGLLWLVGGAGQPEAPTSPVLSEDSPATPIGPLPLVDEEVVVHVAGRVVSPGLYRLPGGARAADAIEAAGGPLADAVLESVNLARPVSDGEQLRVPGPEDTPPVPDGAPDAAAGRRPDGLVDLNLATAAELQELPGIGPVMAERIVDHRESNGPFQAVSDLRDVSGIGEKTFQKLAPLVGV